MLNENHGVADSADLLRIQKEINQALDCGQSRLAISEGFVQAILEFVCLDCVWLWSQQVTDEQMKLEGCAGAGPDLHHVLNSLKTSRTLANHLMVGHDILDSWEVIWGPATQHFKDDGFNQVGVLAINLGANQLGAIGFASRSAKQFDPRLLELLRQSTRNLNIRLNLLDMEKHLFKSSLNIKEVFGALDNPLFVVDPGGKILSTSFKVGDTEFYQKSIDTILPGGQRIVEQHSDSGLANSTMGTSCLKKSRLVNNNGDLVPVDVSVKKGFWNGHEAYFLSCRDITQQLVIEKERDRLVTAIEQTADSILITNSSGAIQYTNPAFSKLTGYSAEEVLGANPRILKSKKHNDEFYRQMWSTIHRGDIWKGRLVNCKKSGEEYWEVATISPVRDSNGIITHFVGVKSDISNEMKLEERLRQSQKLEAIGTLAGGIAHDFNNILYALLGNSQLALDDIPEGHPAHLPLTEIVKAGDRGSALVSKMLTFGQRSDHQMKVQPLGAIISEVMALSRASLPTTLEIRLDLDENCSNALLDETQIHQVILNLCTNASHAMKDGTGVLSLVLRQVTVEEDTPEDLLGVIPGQYLRLKVSDTGCGMDSALTSRIFEPYFSTKKPNEGTGLGLASVHGIISNHGGRVFVDSTLGEGTMFTIFLPVAKENVVPEKKETQQEAQPMGHGRVMVVDDEQMITDLVVRGLRKNGFDVTGFVDGIEALEVFRKDPEAFDIVITDQTMPNITGFELASHLSSIRPELPIVLSTGYGNSVDEHDLKAVGISHFLSKPMKIKELVGLLCEISESMITIKGD